VGYWHLSEMIDRIQAGPVWGGPMSLFRSFSRNTCSRRGCHEKQAIGLVERAGGVVLDYYQTSAQDAPGKLPDVVSR